MLPNDALKAVRSATSASPRSWVTGWWPPTSVDPSPFHSRSAISKVRSAIAPQAGTIRAMAFTGFGKGAIAFYDDLAANNTRDWWLANKAPLRGRGPPPDGGAARRTWPSEFGEAKLFRPNRDTRFSKDKSPVQDQHRRGDLSETAAGRCTCRCPPRGCTSAAAATTSSAPARPPPRGRSTTTAPARSSRRSPPTLRKAKADVTAHDVAQDRPARLLRRPPAHRPAPPGGIIGIWAHRPGAWLHTRQGQGPGRRRLATAPTPQRLAGRTLRSWPRHARALGSHRGARSRMAWRVSMPKGRRARAGVVTPLST